MIDDAESDETTEDAEPAFRDAAGPFATPGATDLEALQERVQRVYGAFGVPATEGDAAETWLPRSRDSWRNVAWLLAGLFAASTFLSFVSHPTFDDPGAWSNSFRIDTVFAVVWGPLLYLALARQSLRESLRVYLVLALFIEAFSEVMFVDKGEGGYWDSVMWPAAVAYYGTIKEFSGLPGASLPVFFFATVGLLARAVWGRRGAGIEPPPRFARNAMLFFLGVVGFLSLVGLARGGQVDWTFRQIFHLIQLPLVGLLFLYAVRVPHDLFAVGTIFVVTAVARSLLVVWVYLAVCVPKGITELPGKPEWCTTHSDTVLFVCALVVLMAHALEQRRRRVTLRCAALGALVFLGIVLNNRRLAFVSLGLAPLVVYLALDPSKRKRRVTMALALLLPLVLGYVLVGAESTSDSALLKPAKGIISVLDQRDTSSLSRDIENENLIYTLRQSPIFMQGFGHEYEFSPNNPPVDLSGVFQNYRLIAHNGVLWLWSLAGCVGFTLLWLVYPLAGTLAMRGYRAAEAPIERSAALAALGGVAVCVVQIWGDQGLSSYMTLVTFGVCFAVASRLAVRDA